MEVSALDIGRENFTSPSVLSEMSEVERRYWWNVFRSIVFLERFASHYFTVAVSGLLTSAAGLHITLATNHELPMKI
jgi:hypothetical protein